MHPETRAFSLVEVVMALGIFAFCIVAIVALLPVGLRSARSVADESNAVNIGESIFGAWDMQRSKEAPLTIAGMVSNLPALTQGVADREIFFDSTGRQVEGAEGASLKMFYSVNPQVQQRRSTVRLRFHWPPTAPDDTAQTRDLIKIFAL